MIPWPVTVEEGAVSIDIDDAVYPRAAIQGAAVVQLARAWVRLATPAPGRTRLTLRPKQGAGDGELAALGGEVLNELLHQALRLDVGARTEKLRELVIGKAAMAAESAVEAPPPAPAPPDEPVAFVDDPLGIAKPWEERFGAKKDES
jgi:hypothetical protein